MVRAKWVIFDLDGTLTTSEVMAHVGERAGFGDHARDLISRYERGLVSNDAVSRSFASQLEGWSRHDLTLMLEDIPVVADIERVIGELREREVGCSISTVTFDFAAHYFAMTYGFDHFSASKLEYTRSGISTGYVLRALEAEHKVTALKELCVAKVLSANELAFVGNGRSDLDAMQWCGISIAFNATSDSVERIACHSARSNSLSDAFVELRSACNAERRPPCAHRRLAS